MDLTTIPAHMHDGPFATKSVPDVQELCAWDFMKCGKCGRICTQVEMAHAVRPDGGTGQACPCGSLKYSPFQITWQHYQMPQVIRYARTRFSDRQVRSDLWQEAEAAGVTFLQRCVELARLWWAQSQVVR